MNVASKKSCLKKEEKKKQLNIQEYFYNTCMEEKKSGKYRSTRSLPLTDACFYTAQDLYTLRKFKTDVTTNNLPRWMVKLYRKFEVILKNNLWAYWTVNLKNPVSTIDYDNYSPWVRTDLTFDPESGTADLIWMTEKENSEFKGMKLSDTFSPGGDDLITSLTLNVYASYQHGVSLYRTH